MQKSILWLWCDYFVTLAIVLVTWWKDAGLLVWKKKKKSSLQNMLFCPLSAAPLISAHFPTQAHLNSKSASWSIQLGYFWTFTVTTVHFQCKLPLPASLKHISCYVYVNNTSCNYSVFHSWSADMWLCFFYFIPIFLARKWSKELLVSLVIVQMDHFSQEGKTPLGLHCNIDRFKLSLSVRPLMCSRGSGRGCYVSRPLCLYLSVRRRRSVDGLIETPPSRLQSIWRVPPASPPPR